MPRKLLLIPFILIAAIGFTFAQSEATYSVTYTSTWSEATHPHPGMNFPASAHYSKLVGATHNDQVVFLEAGSIASPGIEDVAEMGNNTEFFSEVNSAISAGDANLLIDGPDLSTSTGQIEINDIVTTEEYPLLTLVSMIAPSPDWIVYVNSVELLDTNGDWEPSITIDLYPYDAGTDSGTDYTSPNQNTNPQEPIASLQGIAPFSNEIMGTLTITLESVLNTTDQQAQRLRVFPNPTNGLVTVSGNFGTTSLEVYNVLGAQVMQRQLTSEETQMDISNLPSGVYMFRMTGSDGSSIVKKVVKR